MNALKISLLLWVSMVALGCKDQESKNKPTKVGVTHITTDQGVDCVIYKFQSVNEGGAGISCNWDEFNQRGNR